jgi:micrococcal nuclease
VALLWPLLVLLALFVGFLQLLTTDGGTATTPGPGGTASPSPTPLTTPTPPFALSNLKPLQQVAVIDVIDGDTIDVRIDGEVRRVRYYGIDTPERGERCYDEATERNQELVGLSVRLKADARDQDEGGRLLRYVFTDDGVSVEAILLAEGLAEAWREDGTYRFRFIALEDHARNANTGCLWK